MYCTMNSKSTSDSRLKGSNSNAYTTASCLINGYIVVLYAYTPLIISIMYFCGTVLYFDWLPLVDVIKLQLINTYALLHASITAITAATVGAIYTQHSHVTKLTEF
jgi:hypothetical protein